MLALEGAPECGDKTIWTRVAATADTSAGGYVECCILVTRVRLKCSSLEVSCRTGKGASEVRRLRTGSVPTQLAWHMRAWAVQIPLPRKKCSCPESAPPTEQSPPIPPPLSLSLSLWHSSHDRSTTAAAPEGTPNVRLPLLATCLVPSRGYLAHARACARGHLTSASRLLEQCRVAPPACAAVWTEARHRVMPTVGLAP